MDIFFEKYFDYFFMAALIWGGIVVFASILYRAKNHKQFPNLQNGILKFHERWVSGRSMKNIFTQFGGARNCLDVRVGGGYITVRPIFPFNLAFLPELMGLELVIPLTSVRNVSVVSTFGRKGVSVRYDQDNRSEGRVELYLRDTESFLGSLGRKV